MRFKVYTFTKILYLKFSPPTNVPNILYNIHMKYYHYYYYMINRRSDRMMNFSRNFKKKKLWSIGKPDRDKTPTGGNFPPSENRASGGIFPTECFGLLSKLIVPRQDYSIAHCTMECTTSHVSARLRQVGKTIGHRIALFDNGGFP